jgi:hypothetical protein
MLKIHHQLVTSTSSSGRDLHAIGALTGGLYFTSAKTRGAIRLHKAMPLESWLGHNPHAYPGYGF